MPVAPHIEKANQKATVGWRKFAFGIAFALLWACAGSSAAAEQRHAPDEYEVKSLFLFNFARFVEWPEQDASRPIHICVVEDDAIARKASAALNGKSVGSRPVAVYRVHESAEAGDCEVVFFPEASIGKATSMLSGGIRRGALTVGESRAFLELGGMINFVIEDDRVRFDISVTNADRRNVKMSSKLLSLGKVVRTGREGGKK